MTKKHTLPLEATKQRLLHWAYWYDRELLGHLDPDHFILMSELMAERRLYCNGMCNGILRITMGVLPIT